MDRGTNLWGSEGMTMFSSREDVTKSVICVLIDAHSEVNEVRVQLTQLVQDNWLTQSLSTMLTERHTTAS